MRLLFGNSCVLDISLLFYNFQVFEYNQVVRDVVDIHYPVHEMTCNSKIRCLLIPYEFLYITTSLSLCHIPLPSC